MYAFPNDLQTGNKNGNISRYQILCAINHTFFFLKWESQIVWITPFNVHSNHSVQWLMYSHNKMVERASKRVCHRLCNMVFNTFRVRGHRVRRQHWSIDPLSHQYVCWPLLRFHLFFVSYTFGRTHASSLNRWKHNFASGCPLLLSKKRLLIFRMKQVDLFWSNSTHTHTRTYINFRSVEPH